VPSALAAYELAVSSKPDRSGAEVLAGKTLSATLTSSCDRTPARRRRGLRSTRRPPRRRKTENRAPWDFAGTGSDGKLIAFDTGTVANGAHRITAEVDIAGGATDVVSVATAADEPHPSVCIATTGASSDLGVLAIASRDERLASPTPPVKLRRKTLSCA
jgi:hypothetical protein